MPAPGFIERFHLASERRRIRRAVQEVMDQLSAEAADGDCPASQAEMVLKSPHPAAFIHRSRPDHGSQGQDHGA